MSACPICDGRVRKGDPAARPPFCSQRCKLLDLDNWLGGRYVVAQALPWGEDGEGAGALDLSELDEEDLLRARLGPFPSRED